jgi:predicted amidohydrolase
MIRRIGFLQLEIITGDIKSNLRGLKDELEKLSPPENSLLVLPELWITGFSYTQMDNLYLEIDDVFSELQKSANELDICFAGTFPEKAKDNKYYNSLWIIDSEGKTGPYRKQFLFPGEELCFVPDQDPPKIIDSRWGRLGGIVCYDLRFPNVSRKLAQQGADILICASQWPALRVDHWKALLLARAIENQIFIVGCNGIGRNGDTLLGGHSMIISPDGMILKESGDSIDSCVVEIDMKEIWEVRQRFNSVDVVDFS